MSDLTILKLNRERIKHMRSSMKALLSANTLYQMDEALAQLSFLEKNLDNLINSLTNNITIAHPVSDREEA